MSSHFNQFEIRVWFEVRWSWGGYKICLLLIANDGPLGEEWLDHALTGDWADHRECHVGGDFLLIYRLHKRGSHESVIFVRTGTHAELFE